MREEARHERQRETHRALYERFAAGTGLPIEQPSEPELTGTGHYRQSLAAAEDSWQEPADQESPDGEGTDTRFLPAQAAAASDAPAFAGHEDAAQEHYPEEPEAAQQAAVLSSDPHDDQAAQAAAAGKAQRRKRTKRKRNLVMLATVLIFALVVAGSVYFVKSVLKQFNPDDYPGPGGAAVEFTVEDGWGLKIISRKLEELDVVSSDGLFTDAVADSEAQSKLIHPGTYLLKKQMPAADAADILVNQRPDKVFYIGLKANMRLDAAIKEIAKGSGLAEKDLQALAKKPQQFGLPASVPSLEGWLHPGEYRFPLNADAEEVLGELVKATKASLEQAGITDLEEGYRTLKVASILQAEARTPDYATVAGAIENRLDPGNRETHGLLQVDSSVIYGLDRYSLQFSAQEKQDASNKYNTYVHTGLPPTPLGSPANSAIEAAAHPESNGYYYWVTVNIETGETKFASTYAEHRQNQAEFRAWCNQNPGVC
ncbi:endolytic transglycosylase MltG [Glutamicibacter sp. NPDC087831]|uniref:endolytic transglycosylase MltG n=1 Tax=Glutamicibacter sp. NPDC087831 TaxID=3363998 RepID=UPI0037F86B79